MILSGRILNYDEWYKWKGHQNIIVQRDGAVKRVPCQFFYVFSPTSFPVLSDVPITMDGKRIGVAKLSADASGVNFACECEVPKTFGSYSVDFRVSEFAPADSERNSHHRKAVRAQVHIVEFFSRGHGWSLPQLSVDGRSYRAYSGWGPISQPSAELEVLREILEAIRCKT